jgi:hypothetical protein
MELPDGSPSGADDSPFPDQTSTSPLSSENGKFEEIPRRSPPLHRPRFAQRVGRIRVFISSYSQRIVSENRTYVLPESIVREARVISTAPGCPYVRKLFALGLIAAPT